MHSMEGVPKPQRNKAERTKQMLSKARNYGLALLSTILLSQMTEAQTAHHNIARTPQESPFNANDLPPVYTRTPVSPEDAENLKKYYEEYKENQQKIKTGEVRGRFEPFNIEQFPFWKEFDKSLWPKQVVYCAPTGKTATGAQTGAYPVYFVLPPVPVYPAQEPQAVVNGLTKPSVNFPWLNEIFEKDAVGRLQFDHYEDQATKMFMGTDYLNPIKRPPPPPKKKS